jgi:putative transposase
LRFFLFDIPIHDMDANLACVDIFVMGMISGIGHQALRRGRVSLAAGRYLVTAVAFERVPWFSDPCVARAVVELHANDGLFDGAACLSWVLMPDHWHGVIELDAHCTLAAALNRFKSRTGFLVNKMLERRGPVWARAYHDRAIRCDEDYAAALRYIALNPVRARLCTHPSEYPYSHLRP